MEVEPVLGSTLYEAHLAKEGQGTTMKLKAGRQSIDQILDGGIDYGTLSCFSTENDTACPDIVFDTAISHLLAHPDANVTAILHATINSFDIRRLRDRLVQALLNQGTPQPNVKSEAVEILRRVTLMRVFDFVGMSECVSEYREHLAEEARRAAEEELAPVTARKTTIPDSQSDADEEIRSSPPAAETPKQSKEHAQNGLLLIDSFSSLVQPVVRIKEPRNQGQVLLNSFTRSLRHLTYAYNICTILVCSTEMTKEDISSPSIFASCTARPTLGITLSPLIDLHLLIHLVPKTAEDAKQHFSTQPTRPNAQPDLSTVLEILQDRHSSREGRWTSIP